MKSLIHLPLALFAIGTLAAQNPAPDKNKTDKPGDAPKTELKTELLPNQQAFLNLPGERRTEFAKHINEATRLFNEKRIFETLAELDKAEAIFKDSPEIGNLRGSCHVEFRAFDKAMDDFKAADALAPNNPSVSFNMAEVLFVTHKWKECLDRFNAVLTSIPQDQLAMRRLVEFKILLCTIKIGSKETAEKLSNKYDFLDDSPYYYYSKAALEYQAGNEIKAEEWLAMASRVFTQPEILSPWQDTLIEFGYIKSFYGGEGEGDS
jgi:tetratricopeptide (TPR) repeat protein